METAELKKLVERLAPEALLQCVKFGKSTDGCAWIETGALLKVCAALRAAEAPAFDWLENLSAMQMDEVIVLTYFLRSRVTGRSCRIRSSVEITDADAAVKFPSVDSVWPAAGAFEKEISEMFGVEFSKAPEQESNAAHWAETRILPVGWQGFPLRKSFTLNVPITTPDAGGIE